MNQLVSMDGNHMPLCAAGGHTPRREAYVESDRNRMLRAAPNATVGAIAPYSAFASRPAATRKLPQPAHTIFGDVE